MDDLNLRLEFHRALDVVAPPAPWLAPRVREALRGERRVSWFDRVRQRQMQSAWLLPLVAVLLAGAIIASLLLGAHAFRLPTVPIHPPQNIGTAGGAPCPTWGFIPGGGNAPASVKMTSVTTGWAPGDLRTVDGGAHWHDVSPASLRSDAPYLPGQETVYPPSYADYFLDSTHAWLVRSYGSSSACIDHLSVFSTSDGGRSWQKSAPIAMSFGGDMRLQLILDFLDAKRGWLLALDAPRGGALYATVDGGRSWRVDSTMPPGCPTLLFNSPTTGWSTCGTPNSGGPRADLLVTRDGGVTWRTQTLPDPPHGCGCSVALPVFFDAMHGAVQVFGNSGQDVFVTSDGGKTWSALPSVPGQAPTWVSIGFEDARDFWLVAAAGGKGGPPGDTLYHSADGGRSWQLVQKDIPVGFSLGQSGAQIQFVDPEHGFVLQTNPQTGRGSQLIVTTDGGHTWNVIQVQIS